MHKILTQSLKFNQNGFWNMNKKFKGIQVFLPIAISLFILASPAYILSNKLPKIKFACSDLGFEIPDQEEGLSNKENESKGFGSTAFPTVFFLVTKLLNQSSHLFPLFLSLQQEIPILRCWENTAPSVPSFVFIRAATLHEKETDFVETSDSNLRPRGEFKWRSRDGLTTRRWI